MIFVSSLLFGFCSLLQLDERLSVQATHWRVLDELTREGGVLSLGENLFPLDPRGHLWVTWGVYLCAGKPPLADIIVSNPPDLTRCDSVIGLAIPAMSGHIQYRGAAS